MIWLTLNLGLRHDIWLPYEEVLDRESFFNPTQPNPQPGTPGILEFYNHFPDTCGCENTVATDWHNFGPRLDVASTLGRTPTGLYGRGTR